MEKNLPFFHKPGGGDGAFEFAAIQSLLANGVKNADSIRLDK